MSQSLLKTVKGLNQSVLAVVCLLGIFVLSPELKAQSANPVRPAVMSFSVDIAKLKSSALAPLFSQMESAPVTSGPQAIIAAAKSISGSFSLPASAQDLMTMGPQEDIPFNFVVQVNFPDSATMSKIWDSITADFEPAEMDGISGFRLANEETPNMLFTQLDDVSMAIGTPTFIKQSGRTANSKGVNALMGTLPDHSLKLAIDLSNSTDLLDEVKEMLNGQLPPEAAPFFDVAMKIQSLKLSFDMEAEKMLVLGVGGRDEEATKEIFQTVDGLLNMAKFAAGAQIAQMKEDSPQTAEVASKLLAALKPKNEGNEMTLVVDRPEGMDEMLKESIDSARKSANQVTEMNRFRQAALCVHNYHDAYQSFPFGESLEEISKDLSWRVRVLPFLEAANVYDSINKKEGHNSSANQKFADQMPAVLGNGSDSLSDIAHIALDQPVKKFQDITDGTSNTIMLVSNPAGQPWMDPKGLTVDEAVNLYESLKDGETLLTAYFDGSIRKLAKGEMTAEEFRSALIPNDGK